MRIYNFGMKMSSSVIGAVFFGLYLECGAASLARHHQSPEARPPTIRTRLRCNRSTEMVLKLRRSLRAMRWICLSGRFAVCIHSKFGHESGDHISDRPQPTQLIDRGSTADIVTYSPVSGKDQASASMV